MIGTEWRTQEVKEAAPLWKPSCHREHGSCSHKRVKPCHGRYRRPRFHTRDDKARTQEKIGDRFNRGRGALGILAPPTITMIIYGFVAKVSIGRLLIFPIVTLLGFDPVWFGIVVTINVEMGMITPPVGLNLFILKGSVPDISMKDIVGGAAPLLVLLTIGLTTIMLFPPLATWLPGRMGF